MSGPLYPHLGKYVWDPRLRGGRWREVLPDGRLGKIVSNQLVAEKIREVAELQAEQFATLAREVVQGNLSPAVFQETMQLTLKNLYNGFSAIGAGGWDRLTPEMWGRTGGYLRGEYRRLAKFVLALQKGQYADDIDAAAARAALYIENAYGRYWDELTERLRTNGFLFERVITVGDDRVCPICQSAENEGKVPIGTFRLPLHLLCRCEKEYE